jgi:isopentenyldiphosphate isomerase
MTPDEDKRLPYQWQALRHAAAASGFVLDQPLYRQIKHLFLTEYAQQNGSSLAAISREFNMDEFLLVVDSAGHMCIADQAVLDDFADTARSFPAFYRWFRVDRVIEGTQCGQQVLLAARWLCHIAALRHITVEIFLDPPAYRGFTLVQVRGMDKVESPGAFDLPCAGHISGVDGVAASLAKELDEELGLGLDDLDAVREIGRFDTPSGSASHEPQNHEFRILFHARLKTESVGRIRFRDGEVAGLAVISLPELRLLLERYPQRVASGLHEAIGLYPTQEK